MEGFTYIDIFATKGVEYAHVLGFLLAFVLIWKLLQLPTRAARPVPVNKTRLRGPSEWFRLDDDRYYHPGHTWAKPQDDNLVKVGIDDFAHKLLGTPGAVDLPKVGSKLNQGGNGWRFEVGSRPVDMVSPVGGTVAAVNEEVLEDPNVLAEDPYGKGWLMKVRVDDKTHDLRNLLSGGFARAWMDETVTSLRRKMEGNLGTILQDGGVPVTGFVSHLAPDSWHEVIKEFLLSE
jgi:glycine cleavage system H lipoate-binding protein